MTTTPARRRLDRFPQPAVCAIAALVLLGAVALLAFWNVQAVLRGYLAAIVLWLGLPLGAMLLLLTHRLTGGRWGEIIRAPLAAAIAVMPVFAVLVVPAVVGVQILYPWTGQDLHTPGSLVQFKAAYLTEPFFIARSAVYLLIWTALSVRLCRRIRPGQADEHGAPNESDRRFAGLLIVVLVLTISFAFIDWVGTLEPHWFSTVYGMYHIVGQVLFTLAIMIVVIIARRGSAGANELGDLAGLLLASVVLYAYMAYSQFFIIWNGNLPEEIEWYLRRTRSGWGAVIVILLIIQFALPMFALLMRRVKQHPKPLLALAGVLLAARIMDCGWMVLPAFDHLDAVSWISAALAGLGIGCAGGSVFIRRVQAVAARADEHATQRGAPS